MSNEKNEVNETLSNNIDNSYAELFDSILSQPSSKIKEEADLVLQSNPYLMDGGSSVPEMPYADPIYLLEQFGRQAGYITRYEKDGRPLPNAFALYELSNELSTLSSLDASKNIKDFVAELTELIDEHLDYYGFMLTQDVFEDLGGYSHMQSCIAVPSQTSESAATVFTPIMGLNAVFTALKRLQYARNNIGEYAGNTLVAGCELADNEELIAENAFNYLYCGHLSLISTLPYHGDIERASEAFWSPEDEDYDAYSDQLSAVYITVAMNCLKKGEYYDFPSTLSQTPLIYWGYSDLPAMWLSIVTSGYIGHPTLSGVAETASKYQDIFAFLIAASSGLPLSNFQSVRGRRSGFSGLDKEQKTKVLMDLSHLADDICLKMQSSDFLFSTPLVNLYQIPQ